MDVTDDSIRIGAPFATLPVAIEPMPLGRSSQGVGLEFEQRGHRSGTRVNFELLVRVLEVLPNGLRRDSELPRDLGIRLALGNTTDDLSLPRSELIGPAGKARAHAPPRGAATELPQVREQQVEDSAITFPEVGRGAIELQPRASFAMRTQPQAHHVFDAHRPCDLLVQLESLELAAGEELRILP